MPLFDFCCSDCGVTRELLVKSSNAKVTCPECGGRNVERLLSTFAVRMGAPAAPDCRAHCGIDESGAPLPCEGGMCPMKK